MPTTSSKRQLHFDVMNILACLAVVFMHHNSHMHSFDASRSWILSLLIECLCYWCVPVFLMISGANLLEYSKRYDTRTFYWKRIQRAMIPWLIWSVILLGWKIKTNQFRLDDMSYWNLLRHVLTNNVESTYWFFSNIFGCYLITPILTCLTPHKKLLWHTVIGIYILSFIEPWVAVMLPISHAGVVALENSLIIYYILGYLLCNTEFTKKQRILIYLTGLCAFAFRFFVTLNASFANGATDLSVRGNKMCNTVLCGMAVFVFLKQVDWESIIPLHLQHLLPKLASYSLGVYLLHKVAMYYLQHLTDLPIRNIWWKTLFPFATYLVCITVTACLKKIPFLKNYII